MSESALPAATSAGRRIDELDMLRGFALFGILVTNVIVATSLWSFQGTREHPVPTFQGPIDNAVIGVVDALFSGRFYLLFAFLFGYSFTLQIAAAQRAGASADARLLRRCAALLAVGLAHVFFLWVGDILTLYAVLCLLLITMRKMRPRTAVITGAVLYAVWSLWGFASDTGSDVKGFGEIMDLPAIGDRYLGSFIDTLQIQLEVAPLFLLLIWFTQGVTSLAMFLLGMAAGKRGLFEDRETTDRLAPRVLVLGLGVGLPVSVITFADKVDWLDAPGFWFGIQQLVNPLMTFAYIAGIILLARAARTAAATAWLAPAGRMAATNYIGQSVVLMVLYTGYGFALADTIPPAGVLALALLTYATQLLLSAWWLTRHRYGPIEWLLRAATYLQRPPWRTPAPAHARKE
ncbi:DUF418 domain-containing protein [Nocardia puris]|nr:DUF418 domain-containing protein [Nocardia puris]